MLSKPHVWRALESKADVLAAFQRVTGDELEQFDKLLKLLAKLGPDEVRAAVAAIAHPGALPTSERVAGQSVVRPFAPRWENHEQARSWALSILRDTPTLAVDGSQITPSRDFSIPVGAVQVAWFENAHDDAGHYVKDLRFEVLGPNELADAEPDSGGTDAGAFPDRQVNLRRFELECQVLIDAMPRYAGRQAPPVFFLDGSLLLSFAAHMRPELQGRYIHILRALLDASEHHRVPVVGYVDNSYATDLVSLLAHLGQRAAPTMLSDGLVLSRHMGWGDRSEAFVCARDDRLFLKAPDLDYYARVLLVYCKTTAANPPARLDLPAWVLEAGLLDRVLDVVRAECIVGVGYPYAAETADAVAVITMADRERFYRTLQEFTAQLGIDLRYARKASSKRGRR